MCSGVASGLFGSVQQQVLALLYGQPAREFRTSEVIHLAKSGTGAVHRVLLKLDRAGLLESWRLGNQKYYRANRQSPVFQELHGLIIKTVGLAEPIRDALKSVSRQVAGAAVYGSVAKGTDTSNSDVDLLVLSDDLSHPDLYEALRPVEVAIGRPINPTLMTPGEWETKVRTPGTFAARIAQHPMVLVMGTVNDSATA
jgi:predicted nucleotidyltransferase